MSPTTTFTHLPIPSIRFRDVWNFLLPILCWSAFIGAGIVMAPQIRMSLWVFDNLMPEVRAMVSYWSFSCRLYWPLLLLTVVLFRIAGAVVPLSDEAKARWAWGWLSFQQLSLIGLTLIVGLIGYGIASNGSYALFILRM